MFIDRHEDQRGRGSNGGFLTLNTSYAPDMCEHATTWKLELNILTNKKEQETRNKTLAITARVDKHPAVCPFGTVLTNVAVSGETPRLD